VGDVLTVEQGANDVGALAQACISFGLLGPCGLLVSTALDRAGEPTNGDLALMPDEGCVIALD
jgi:hypothetical protein